MRNSVFLLCARLFALLIEKQSKEKRKRQISPCFNQETKNLFCLDNGSIKSIKSLL